MRCSAKAMPYLLVCSLLPWSWSCTGDTGTPPMPASMPMPMPTPMPTPTPTQMDTTPPTFAGAVSVEAATNTMTLKWAAASDDQTPPDQIVYLIYLAFSQGEENFAAPLITTDPGVTQFVINELGANTTYYFVVRARDLAFNIDSNKNEVSGSTLDVSFVKDVQPIFANHCVNCHGGLTPDGSLNLSTAAAAYAGLVNRNSTECMTTPLIVGEQPEQSYLIWKLMGMGTCFMGDPMPKDESPLEDAEMATIYNWINSGARNN